MLFYEKIDYLCKINNLTRKKMCEDTGISYATIGSMFARQSTNIGLETIRLIASYFNVTLDYLIDDNILLKEVNKKASPIVEEGSDMCSSLSQEAQEIGGLFDKASDDDKDVVRFALRKYKDTVAKNSNLDTKEAM